MVKIGGKLFHFMVNPAVARHCKIKNYIIFNAETMNIFEYSKFSTYEHVFIKVSDDKKDKGLRRCDQMQVIMFLCNVISMFVYHGMNTPY